MHPLERLVNLVALLLESRTPLTFEQIRSKLAEGYGHQDASSAKRMFERDKDVLRDIGVPIDVVSTDAWDVEHGYTIEKDRYYLPEIAFTPEELSALFVAVRSAGDVSAEEAVRKLLSGADRGILAGL
ncbi:MAG TPA: WYL domain-containing protein, partial [Actinomycetota bacterium]